MAKKYAGTLTVDTAVRAVENQIGRLTGRLNGLQNTLDDVSRSVSDAFRADDVAEFTGKTTQAATSAVKAAQAQTRLASGIATADKAAKRSLASFDELERLQSPDTSGSGSKGSSKKSSSSSSPGEELAEEAARSKSFWDSLPESLEPAIAAWRAAWQQIRETALEVWPQIRAAAQDVWDNALSPLLDYLRDEFVPGFLNSFSEAFAPIVGGVVSTGIRVFADLFVWFCQLLTEAVNTVILPAMQLLLTIWQDTMAAIQQVWLTYGQTILDGVVLAFQNLEGILTAFWENFVSPILNNLLIVLQQLWQEHLLPLWTDLLSMFAQIGTALLSLWNEVLAPLVTWVIETFFPTFSQVFNAIVTVIVRAVGTISDWIDIAVNVFRGVLDFLDGVFRGDWDAAWQAIGDTVDRVWSGMGKTVKSWVNTILGFVNRMISAVVSGYNALVGALNSLHIEIPDWVPGLGGSSFGFSLGTVTSPQIPYLAQGAVIPANREFLAVLGDQTHGTNVEAPLATIQQAVAEVMQDLQAGQMAGFEAVVAVLREILSAVYGIELTDEQIGRAARRWQQRQLITTGGAF